MAWPTNSIPTYGRGVWLECNGQSFSKTRFPQLFETLGRTTVPDYRNVFLEGSDNAWKSIQAGIPNVQFNININGFFMAYDNGSANNGELGGLGEPFSGVFQARDAYHGYVDDNLWEAPDFVGESRGADDYVQWVSEKGLNGTAMAEREVDFNYDFSYSASSEHAVYGRSNTVQPPTMTVKWMIKAK